MAGDADADRREAVRRGVAALIELGTEKRELARGAGVSVPTLYAFLDDPTSSSEQTVDALYDWLMGRAQKATPERRAIAGWLRFLARMLESDQDVAELVFPAAGGGGGGEPPSGAVAYPPPGGAEEAG